MEHIHTEFELGLYHGGTLNTEAFNNLAYIYSSRSTFDTEKLRRGSLWVHEYFGKVPARWKVWHDVMKDFENAGEALIQLSPTLVQAGLDYPDPRVVAVTAKNQLLGVEQLACLLVGNDLPILEKVKVIKAQEARNIYIPAFAVDLAKKMKFGWKLQ